MNDALISPNETHLFMFPDGDFNGQAVGSVFASPLLKLPSVGDWWVWGVLCSRTTVHAAGEMPSTTEFSLGIYDSGLSQYWWTGGSVSAQACLPIQQVAGIGGRPGLFSEPKLVRGGSNLTPYWKQNSGVTPTGASPVCLALICTLADSANGTAPIVPSLSSIMNQAKGESYKILLDFANPSGPGRILPGQTLQMVVPLNKNSDMIMCQFQSDIQEAFTSAAAKNNWDPRVIRPNIRVNLFDTRTTWKFASPSDVLDCFLFGMDCTLPFVAPSFMFMEKDQNLAWSVSNQDNSPITPKAVVDGYLQEAIIAERVR